MWPLIFAARTGPRRSPVASVADARENAALDSSPTAEAGPSYTATGQRLAADHREPGPHHASFRDGTVVQTVPLPQCTADLVRAAGVAEGSHAILYIHGGGFVLGSSRMWRSHLVRLSALTGIPVLSVDYRMVPGDYVSDSIEDCVTGYQWLLARGYEGRNIVLAGDSAGANLAFQTALRARRDGLPRAAAVAAMSPWVDLAASGPSYRSNWALDPTWLPKPRPESPRCALAAGSSMIRHSRRCTRT